MTLSRLVIVVAQTATESFETIEFSLPESAGGMLALIIGFALLTGLMVRISLRDSRFLKRGWRFTLPVPRLAVLALLAAIVLNPSQRIQTSRTEQSRVGILLDTSLSMAWPAAESAEKADSHESEMLQRLSQTHAVSLYTFDSELTGPHAVYAGKEVRLADHPGSPEPEASVDEPDHALWQRILVAQGSETRLGESLHELIGRMAGRTLSGIVVFTDGQTNTGLDPRLARQRAERSETRLITVGLGSQAPQTNIWVAGMQAPPDVHRGDPFDVTVIVQSNRIEPLPGRVELYEQTAGGAGRDRRKVAEKPFTTEADGLPVPQSWQSTT